MAHRVTIGEPDSLFYLEFESQQDALDFFSNMLGRYRNGQSLGDPDASHLQRLLERHPKVADKIGNGIKRFFKDRSGYTDSFWLERTDGGKTEFSFKKCVSGKPETLLQEFAEACRYSVQDSLTHKKAAFFKREGNSEGKVRCEITDELVAPYDSHLDHKPPLTFQVIVLTFIKASKIELKPEIIARHGDGEFSRKLADSEIAANFISYHDSVADLRIVSKRKNLQLAGSHRIVRAKRPVR